MTLQMKVIIVLIALCALVVAEIQPLYYCTNGQGEYQYATEDFGCPDGWRLLHNGEQPSAEFLKREAEIWATPHESKVVGAPRAPDSIRLILDTGASLVYRQTNVRCTSNSQPVSPEECCLQRFSGNVFFYPASQCYSGQSQNGQVLRILTTISGRETAYTPCSASRRCTQFSTGQSCYCSSEPTDTRIVIIGIGSPITYDLSIAPVCISTMSFAECCRRARGVLYQGQCYTSTPPNTVRDVRRVTVMKGRQTLNFNLCRVSTCEGNGRLSYGGQCYCNGPPRGGDTITVYTRRNEYIYTNRDAPVCVATISAAECCRQNNGIWWTEQGGASRGCFTPQGQIPDIDEIRRAVVRIDNNDSSYAVCQRNCDFTIPAGRRQLCMCRVLTT